MKLQNDSSDDHHVYSNVEFTSSVEMEENGLTTLIPIKNADKGYLESNLDLLHLDQDDNVSLFYF